MDGLDCLGASEIGFDFGTLFQTAGTLAEGGANIYEAQQAEKKASEASVKSLGAAIKADLDASNAMAKAAVSVELKSKSATADKKAAEQAIAKQDKVGADLSPEDAQSRVTSAEQMLADTKTRASKNPKDGYLPVLVNAWQTTVDKLHGSTTEKGSMKESWFSRPVLGPLSGTSVVVGSAILIGGIILILKR